MGMVAWQQSWRLWSGAAGFGRLPDAAGRVLVAGLAPVHGRAVANARRLRRRR